MMDFKHIFNRKLKSVDKAQPDDASINQFNWDGLTKIVRISFQLQHSYHHNRLSKHSYIPLIPCNFQSQDLKRSKTL